MSLDRLIFAGLLVLISFVGIQAIQPGASAAMAQTGGTVLFHWRIPKSGHIGSWAANKGVLHYGGGAAGRVTASFSLAGINDFAVQAQMRNTGPGPTYANLNGYGLMLQGQDANPHTSVMAGSFFAQTEEDTNPEIAWGGQTVGGAAFDPKRAWHTYRLDVHGKQYSLSIDGKPMVTATLPDVVTPARVGVFSLYYQADVKNLTVSRIGSATAQPPLDTTDRDANLSVGDLPTTGFYQLYLQHWYTTTEVARERGVSEGAVAATGRQSGYANEYFARSREVNDIYSSVATFSTAAQARQNVIDRMKELRQATPPHTEEQDLTGLNIGDYSDGFRVEVSAQGITLRLVVIYVARGNHSVLIRNTFDSQLSPDKAASVTFTANLARIVASRLSASG